MVWRGEINLNEGWEKSVGGHVKASWPVGEREQSLRLGGRASFSHLYKAAEGRRGVGGAGWGAQGTGVKTVSNEVDDMELHTGLTCASRLPPPLL